MEYIRILIQDSGGFGEKMTITQSSSTRRRFGLQLLGGFAAALILQGGFILSASPAVAASVKQNSVVQIILKRGDETKKATGFVAASSRNNIYVVTNYGLAKWYEYGYEYDKKYEGKRVIHIAFQSRRGARPTKYEITKYETKKEFILDHAAGLAILRISRKGISLPRPLPISSNTKQKEPEELAANIVRWQTKEKIPVSVEGTKSIKEEKLIPEAKGKKKYIRKKFKQQALQLNPSEVKDWTEEDFGAPLINVCGEVMGVSRPEQDGVVEWQWRQWRRYISYTLKKQEYKNLAVPAIALIKALRALKKQDQQMQFRTSPKCVHPDKKEKIRLQNEHDKAKQEAEEERRKAEEERIKREEFIKLVLYVAWAVGLLVLISALIFWRYHWIATKKAGEGGIIKARTPAPGARPIGIEVIGKNDARFKLNIAALALSQKGGAIIGRDPELTHQIHEDYGEISRKHLRFFVDNGQIMIEDLGSTNGTELNGRPLPANTPVNLSDGDEVVAAKSVRLNITFGG